MNLKLLPYFLEEEGIKSTKAISLAKNTNFLSVDDALFISEYMGNAIVIDEWLSNTQDIFTKEFVIPSKTWSDGVYVWDSSHIYYVKKYRARMPKDFINHVKNRLGKSNDFSLMDKNKIYSEFEAALEKIVAGDESVYDFSY